MDVYRCPICLVEGQKRDCKICKIRQGIVMDDPNKSNKEQKRTTFCSDRPSQANNQDVMEMVPKKPTEADKCIECERHRLPCYHSIHNQAEYPKPGESFQEEQSPKKRREIDDQPASGRSSPVASKRGSASKNGGKVRTPCCTCICSKEDYDPPKCLRCRCLLNESDFPIQDKTGGRCVSQYYEPVSAYYIEKSQQRIRNTGDENDTFQNDFNGYDETENPCCYGFENDERSTNISNIDDKRIKENTCNNSPNIFNLTTLKLNAISEEDLPNKDTDFNTSVNRPQKKKHNKATVRFCDNIDCITDFPTHYRINDNQTKELFFSPDTLSSNDNEECNSNACDENLQYYDLPHLQKSPSKIDLLNSAPKTPKKYRNLSTCPDELYSNFDSLRNTFERKENGRHPISTMCNNEARTAETRNCCNKGSETPQKKYCNRSTCLSPDEQKRYCTSPENMFETNENCCNHISTKQCPGSRNVCDAGSETLEKYCNCPTCSNEHNLTYSNACTSPQNTLEKRGNECNLASNESCSCEYLKSKPRGNCGCDIYSNTKENCPCPKAQCDNISTVIPATSKDCCPCGQEHQNCINSESINTSDPRCNTICSNNGVSVPPNSYIIRCDSDDDLTLTLKFQTNRPACECKKKKSSIFERLFKISSRIFNNQTSINGRKPSVRFLTPKQIRCTPSNDLMIKQQHRNGHVEYIKICSDHNIKKNGPYYIVRRK